MLPYGRHPSSPPTVDAPPDREPGRDRDTRRKEPSHHSGSSSPHLASPARSIPSTPRSLSSSLHSTGFDARHRAVSVHSNRSSMAMLGDTRPVSSNKAKGKGKAVKRQPWKGEGSVPFAIPPRAGSKAWQEEDVVAEEVDEEAAEDEQMQGTSGAPGLADEKRDEAMALTAALDGSARISRVEPPLRQVVPARVSRSRRSDLPDSNRPLAEIVPFRVASSIDSAPASSTSALAADSSPKIRSSQRQAWLSRQKDSPRPPRFVHPFAHRRSEDQASVRSGASWPSQIVWDDDEDTLDPVRPELSTLRPPSEEGLAPVLVPLKPTSRDASFHALPLSADQHVESETFDNLFSAAQFTGAGRRFSPRERSSRKTLSIASIPESERLLIERPVWPAEEEFGLKPAPRRRSSRINQNPRQVRKSGSRGNLRENISAIPVGSPPRDNGARFNSQTSRKRLARTSLGGVSAVSDATSMAEWVSAEEDLPDGDADAFEPIEPTLPSSEDAPRTSNQLPGSDAAEPVDETAGLPSEEVAAEAPINPTEVTAGESADEALAPDAFEDASSNEEHGTSAAHRHHSRTADFLGLAALALIQAGLGIDRKPVLPASSSTRPPPSALVPDSHIEDSALVETPRADPEPVGEKGYVPASPIAVGTRHDIVTGAVPSIASDGASLTRSTSVRSRASSNDASSILGKGRPSFSSVFRSRRQVAESPLPPIVDETATSPSLGSQPSPVLGSDSSRRPSANSIWEGDIKSHRGYGGWRTRSIFGGKNDSRRSSLIEPKTPPLPELADPTVTIRKSLAAPLLSEEIVEALDDDAAVSADAVLRGLGIGSDSQTLPTVPARRPSLAESIRSMPSLNPPISAFKGRNRKELSIDPSAKVARARWDSSVGFATEAMPVSSRDLFQGPRSAGLSPASPAGFAGKMSDIGRRFRPARSSPVLGIGPGSPGLDNGFFLNEQLEEPDTFDLPADATLGSQSSASMTSSSGGVKPPPKSLSGYDRDIASPDVLRLDVLLQRHKETEREVITQVIEHNRNRRDDVTVS